MINIIDSGYYIVEFADNFYFVTVAEGITDRITLKEYEKWREKCSVGICLDAGYPPQQIPHYVFDKRTKYERVDLNEYFTQEEQLKMYVIDHKFNEMLIDLWAEKRKTAYDYIKATHAFLQAKAATYGDSPHCENLIAQGR
jgi:hypothetical protein